MWEVSKCAIGRERVGMNPWSPKKGSHHWDGLYEAFHFSFPAAVAPIARQGPEHLQLASVRPETDGNRVFLEVSIAAFSLARIQLTAILKGRDNGISRGSG